MSPTIRIDNEVFEELKERAIEFGLVFETPNMTLRKILSLDGSKSIRNSGMGKTFTHDNKKRWRTDVMDCINKLQKPEFLLKDLYIFEDDLQIKRPNNKHIKEAIRIELQKLKNDKIIEVIKRGEYRVKNDALLCPQLPCPQ